MSRIADGEELRFSDPNDFNSQIREYVKLKASVDMMEKRASELREKLFEKIELDGEVDDKGNVFLELEQNIDGVVRIEKQKRVTHKLDEQTAEELIEEKNLADELFKTVRVVDEDAVMAAHYEGKLSEDDIEAMFPAKIVWALRTAKK